VKLVWKDETGWSQGEDKSEPRTWKAKAAGITLCVTRHIHCAPDQWLGKCYGLAISEAELGPDLEEAKRRLISTAQSAAAAIVAALADDETAAVPSLAKDSSAKNFNHRQWEDIRRDIEEFLKRDVPTNPHGEIVSVVHDEFYAAPPEPRVKMALFRVMWRATMIFFGNGRTSAQVRDGMWDHVRALALGCTDSVEADLWEEEFRNVLELGMTL
jgi:hypothetical protein